MAFWRRDVRRDPDAGDEVVRDDASTLEERRSPTAVTTWSPAQVIGMIVGIGFTVLGIAAVADLGFDTSDLYQPQREVWQLPHSPLLGLGEIGFGVLMIVASVVPGAVRSLMALLGAGALVFGIAILVEAGIDDLRRWFGVEDSNGWLYAITGAAVLLAAMLSPVFVGGGRRTRRRYVRSRPMRSPA
jgi:hypothetical protein